MLYTSAKCFSGQKTFKIRVRQRYIIISILDIVFFARFLRARIHLKNIYMYSYAPHLGTHPLAITYSPSRGRRSARKPRLRATRIQCFSFDCSLAPVSRAGRFSLRRIRFLFPHAPSDQKESRATVTCRKLPPRRPADTPRAASSTPVIPQ